MIDEVTTVGEMRRLAGEWNAMADRLQNPLLRYEWYAAAAEVFARRERPMVLVHRSGPSVGAIAPLSISRNAGYRRLQILGSELLEQPGGLLYLDGELLDDLIHQLPRIGLPAYLHRLRADGLEVESTRLLRRSCFVGHRDGGGAPYLDLAGADWPGHRCADLRRVRGEATFEHREGGGPLLHAALRLAGDVGRFYKTYAGHAAHAGMLRLVGLRVDGRFVAAVMGVEHSRRFWMLRLGCRKPLFGALVLRETVRRAIERDLAGIEFLGRASAWTRMWTTRERPSVSTSIYPWSPHGLGGLGRDFVDGIRRGSG